jgi:hypothetical protein
MRIEVAPADRSWSSLPKLEGPVVAMRLGDAERDTDETDETVDTYGV